MRLPIHNRLRAAGVDQTGRFLAGALGLAIAVRLLGTLLVGGYHTPWLSEYEVIARSMLERGFYGFNFEGLAAMPSSFMPPVYPSFLAGMMALFPGDSDLATKTIQSLLSAFSVLVTFYLAREIFRQNGVALVSAFLAALYPPFIAGALEISTVTPEVLLVQVFALFVFRWYRTGNSWHGAGAGLALGFLSLTRAPAVLLAPLLSLWMLRVRGEQLHRNRGKDTALFLAATALVIAPWTIRNFVVHQAFVPISTNGGLNFWIGNNPGATGEFVYFKEVAPDLFAKSSLLTEVERDSLFYGEALSYIREDPQTFLELLARKALYFWWFRPSIGSSYPDAGQVFEAAKAGMAVAYAAILPLAVVGLLLLRKERAIVSFFGIVTLPYMATSVIYFVATRFRSPVEPFLIVLAAYTIARVARWVGSLGPGPRQPRMFQPLGARNGRSL